MSGWSDDGRDALPDEAPSQGRHRDGTSRARLQSYQGDEHHGRPATNGRDPSIVKARERQSTRLPRSVLTRPRPKSDIAKPEERHPSAAPQNLQGVSGRTLRAGAVLLK